jgi:DNA-binding MarR family transcriptional regulator
MENVDPTGPGIEFDTTRNEASGDSQALERDAWDLHRALNELLRIYQFRDRSRICYYDVSVTQCYALSALVTRGPLNLNRLAAGLYLDKSTASRVVDALVRKGYARRSGDPQDRRAVRLEATEEGLRLHRRIERDLVEELMQLLADYDGDVRQATTRLIARFARAAAERFTRLTTDRSELQESDEAP